MKDDVSKLNFLNNAMDMDWPEAPPVWKDDVLRTLQWRASVSHADARGVCPNLLCRMSVHVGFLAYCKAKGSV